MPDLASKTPRNWAIMTAWLEAEWRSVDADDHPFWRGIYEAYFMIARAIRDCTPEDREAHLYGFFEDALTDGPEADD